MTNLDKLATFYCMAGCAFFSTQFGMRLSPGTEDLIQEIADWLKQRAVSSGETTWAELNDMTNGIPPAFKALDMPELEESDDD